MTPLEKIVWGHVYVEGLKILGDRYNEDFWTIIDDERAAHQAAISANEAIVELREVISKYKDITTPDQPLEKSDVNSP